MHDELRRQLKEHSDYVRSPDYLRKNLQKLAEKTSGYGVLFAPRFYGRGEAATRRFKDDRLAGRHLVARAHETAKNGLKVLAQGETGRAALLLWVAEREYMASFETPNASARLKPGAKPRGRHKGSSPNVDIDRALAHAFDAVDPDIKGDQRWAAAKRALPAEMRAELPQIGRHALRKRRRKGQAQRKA